MLLSFAEKLQNEWASKYNNYIVSIKLFSTEYSFVDFLNYRQPLLYTIKVRVFHVSADWTGNAAILLPFKMKLVEFEKKV